MNARDIIRAMIRERWRQSFCLPNYTPANWWECDVFEITKSDYVKEYEVKISRADFFADAHKSRDIRSTGRWEPTDPANPHHPYRQRFVCDQEKKHDLLAAADVRGPSAFYYVTPVGLIGSHELPAWAGLIEVRTDDRYPGRIFETEVTKAPRIHRQKVDDAVRRHALGVCYYRLHELLNKSAA